MYLRIWLIFHENSVYLVTDLHGLAQLWIGHEGTKK